MTDVDPDVLEVEHQLGLLVRQIYLAAKQSAVEVDPALTPFGLKLLRLLARSGPTHASAAADSLDVDRSLVSRQSKLLDELGLIEVCVDENDGRARFLAATPRALERLAVVDGATERFSRATLGEWSSADLRGFAALLARMTSAAPAEASAASSAA